ncbi:MAG: hypothetical protein WA941_00765 [Nitrososphaeraceae archaeon]
MTSSSNKRKTKTLSGEPEHIFGTVENHSYNMNTSPLKKKERKTRK